MTARADDGPAEPVRIEYQASPGCPDAVTFSAAVNARTTRARAASAGERARTFVVVVAPDGRGVAGRVTIRDLDGRELRRDVTGATCAEVADALALVVALAIDPHASVTPIALPPAASAPPSSASTPHSSTPAPPPASAARPPTVLPSPSVSALPPPRSSPSPLAPRTARVAFGALGAGGVFSTGVTPSTLFGLDVFAELRLAADDWMTPSFRIAFERTASDTLTGANGTARFVWTAGRFDACVRGWRAGRLSIGPCARAEVGAISAAGGGVTHPKNETGPWLALAPAVRARVSIADVLFLDADLALRVALARETFYFEPDATFYEVPVLGVTGGVGFGAVF